MDVSARLPGCDGQAADAVPAYNQVKLEAAPRLVKIPKDGMSRCLDTSSTTEMAQVMGEQGRSRGSCTELVWSIHSLACYGKDTSKKRSWNLDGKRHPNCECLFVHRKNKDNFLSVSVAAVQSGWKKAKYGSHVEEIDEKCGSRRANIIS